MAENEYWNCNYPCSSGSCVAINYKRITNIQEAPDGSVSFTIESTDVTTGLDHSPSSPLQGGDRGRLVLRNGQLLILHGNKTYTITGQEIE